MILRHSNASLFPQNSTFVIFIIIIMQGETYKIIYLWINKNFAYVT